VVATAAAATPVNLEMGDIARQPKLWPPQVILIRTQRFPVIIKGVNVGSVQVPAGRPVTLRKVNPDGTLEIEFQGSPAKVKAQATDLAARAAALAASREKAAPSF
jgi:ribosomal protein L24